MPCKRIKIGAKGYISASQVANMYGCGYGTMIDLYNRFKGLEPETKPSEEALKSMEFGTAFEDAVAKYAAKKLGFGKLTKCGTMAYFKEERPRLICHPDRLVVKLDSKGRRVALEIKCVSPYAEGWGEEDTEEIPDVYYFQVQTYYACDVADIVYVCCMRGNRVYIYKIEPNAEIIADIQKRADKYIDEFEKGIVPSSENYEEQLTITKNKVDWASDAVGANDAMLAVVDKLKSNKELEDKLAKEDDELKRCLLEYMDKSPALVTTENGKLKKLATLVARERKSFDYKTYIANHPEENFNDYWKSTRYVDFRVSYK